MEKFILKNRKDFAKLTRMYSLTKTGRGEEEELLLRTQSLNQTDGQGVDNAIVVTTLYARFTA